MIHVRASLVAAFSLAAALTLLLRPTSHASSASAADLASVRTKSLKIIQLGGSISDMDEVKAAILDPEYGLAAVYSRRGGGFALSMVDSGLLPCL